MTESIDGQLEFESILSLSPQQVYTELAKRNPDLANRIALAREFNSQYLDLLNKMRNLPEDEQLGVAIEIFSGIELRSVCRWPGVATKYPARTRNPHKEVQKFVRKVGVNSTLGKKSILGSRKHYVQGQEPDIAEFSTVIDKVLTTLPFGDVNGEEADSFISSILAGYANASTSEFSYYIKTVAEHIKGRKPIGSVVTDTLSYRIGSRVPENFSSSAYSSLLKVGMLQERLLLLGIKYTQTIIPQIFSYNSSAINPNTGLDTSPPGNLFRCPVRTTTMGLFFDYFTPFTLILFADWFCKQSPSSQKKILKEQSFFFVPEQKEP